VLRPHLCAAASETPIVDPSDWFPQNAESLLDALVAESLLRRRPTGWYWTSPQRAQDLTDLRGSGDTVRIVEDGTGRLLGTIDAAASHRHAHPGAVYVHQGVTHVVRALDLTESVAIVIPEEVDFTTFARDVSDIRIIDVDQSWKRGCVQMNVGAVDVSSQTVAFERRGLDGTLLGVVDLDLPERVLRTRAVWWTFEQGCLPEQTYQDLPGAVHAAEHAAIGLLPLFASCDRWDIGGVSTEFHPDTGATTIFIYDGVPGGAGFTERGALVVHEWIGATLQAVSSCRCTDGCPACIQSPKCGNGNEPLSKSGAVAVLTEITDSFASFLPEESVLP
jgi:DEAD/DEAH box helicase domain-containing protein